MPQKTTGTTTSVSSSTHVPPKTGQDIALATSAPRPVEIRTGTRAMIVVKVVIKYGRIRLRPASTVALRMSAIDIFE
jgi:hypothetical protein